MGAQQRTVISTAMILITLFVVHTALRIEFLTSKEGFALPRTELGKWRAGTPSNYRKWLDRQIGNERYSRYLHEHHDENDRSPNEFIGPPYTASEQQFVDTEMTKNGRHNAILAWVGSFGLLQYILAPLGFSLSFFAFKSNHTPSLRCLSVFCGVCNLAAITIAIYRGYFTSLGY